MKLSICTISFRHQLTSLEHLAEWARRSGFDGIELWGVHAIGLEQQPQYDAKWLRSMGLSISMLSDYLPIVGDKHLGQQKCEHICRLANYWQTNKVRTFAGHQASRSVTASERQAMVNRLRAICHYAEQQGLEVLVETHPNTLADTPASTWQLLQEVDHPVLKLNFDILHVWEAGAEPIDFHHQVAEYVGHYHLKNIASRKQLDVFSPDNVYSPAGTRHGMVPLFDGAFDYRRFLAQIGLEADKSASLEWFGHDVKSTLLQDKAAIDQLRRYTPQHHAVVV
ncbi:3-dehydroshikimate dehydratase [Photobacterium jeanii]|uniref:3-dehydroshikimate dehydratase n=1 Tax=Photobacterium jeanii TaxID=858640 RepID=A0A178KBJ7_9GAMM|nr:sugar phosphate isomerase/epimerase family protein [Photobacterium jeanii]OAN14052.1 3-dehydroshikimate dehydratase [Photobacterium jeanii]PST86935.1 sugar phosphate isomerase/epimerase [Photobacterium jeanii]